MPRSSISLIGRQFGRLTVIAPAANIGKAVAWMCECICGVIKPIRAYCLLRGDSRSCGCLKLEGNRFSHRDSNSPTYISWQSMRQRCRNPKGNRYHRYGGRGIHVCKRWDSYENFLADMGKRPSIKHTIERKNSNNNYNKANCKWATQREQQNNRNNNHRITFQGRTQTLMQWSREVGLKHDTIKERIKAGWNIADSLTKPLGSRRAA